jgi:serine/threonine protein kinase
MMASYPKSAGKKKSCELYFSSMKLGLTCKTPLLCVTSESFDREYKVHESIGKGAFSVVYRCTNIATNEDFAVKVRFNGQSSS